MDLIDIIGYGGAGVVLAAFALSNLRSTRVTPKTLALMNLGAGALSVESRRASHEAAAAAGRARVRFGKV